MAHPTPSHLLLAASWGLIVSAAFGQNAPPPGAPVAVPPIFTSPAAADDGVSVPVPPAPTATAGTHGLSPALAATILTALPTYQDPSAPSATVPARVEPPRNQIPRLPLITLPRVNVRDKRIREFTDRESHTARGLQELAVKRYLSDFDRYFLNRFTLPFVGLSKEARAMALYEQDENVNNWRAIYGYERLRAPNDPPEIPDFSQSPGDRPPSTGPKNADWPKPWPRPIPSSP